MLLNFLDLRVVINDQAIFPLHRRTPVTVTINASDLLLVATDGYHITPPLQVPDPKGTVRRLKVCCAVDDTLLFAGLLATMLLYTIAFYSGWIIPKILCFVPVLIGLYLFYFQRHRFLQVRMVQD